MFVSLFVNIYCEDKINMMKENCKSFKMLTCLLVRCEGDQHTNLFQKQQQTVTQA